MKKACFSAALIVVLLTGCSAPRELRQTIAQKHAESYVFGQRLDTATDAEKNDFIRSTIKDYETLDKYFNPVNAND